MARVFTMLLTFCCLLYVSYQGVKGKLVKCTKTSCTLQGEICVGIKYGRPLCICPPKCKIKVPAIELRYMCGSDGYSYRNLCELDRTACLLGISIQPLYLGKCLKGSLHVSLNHQSKQNFTAGSRVELNCQFTGKPQKVEWSKQGFANLPSSARVRGRSLEFLKISKDDAGTYVCRASDALGKQASTTIDVTIKEPKKPTKPPTEPNQCTEQPTYGNCSQVLVRWYFNREQKTCLPFVYSGCGGNGNRFDNKETCEESCAARAKPGKCPNPTLDTVECNGEMTDECQNDQDCEGDRKCCVWATGCERVCMDPVKQVNKCRQIIDLAFLIDSSGSIRPQEWPQVIKFVKAFLERFDVSRGGTHVGLISYSTDPHLHFRFNTIKGKHRHYEVQNLINEIPRLRGYTFPYKALAMANNELFSSRGGMRETAKKVMIMLIHGRQTTSKEQVVSLDVASKVLKDKGVEIWAVGVGNGVSQNELRDIASDPSKIFAVGSFASIFNVIDKIVPNICKETNLTACQTEYRNAVKNNSTFIPRCATDGSYNNVQCQRHVCYCVDKNGRQIQGTETRIEAGKPRCSRANNKLTDCQRAYGQAISRPELGQHIPRCKGNGMYEEVQCEGRTGDCWCVDIRGQMLPGTKTNLTIQCPPHSDSNKLLTDCQRRYFEVFRNPATEHYLPWCTPEGNYRWLQCHDSYCFCVNKNGDEIPRTRLRSEAGLPNCTAKGAILTPCQRDHIKYGDRFFYPGRYSPTCKPDGRYEEAQCHPSIGTCWCVDFNGQEVPGTKKWGPVSCTTPEKPLTACQKQYQSSQRSRIKGGFSLWCDDAGRFQPMQCFGPECYCVDSNGATIEGTLVSIVQGRPDCKQPTKDQKLSHCQIASETGIRIGVELHTPKCTWYGSYEKIQCQPFSGQCWCVNSNGKELAGTRSNGVVRCPVIGGQLPKCQLEYQEKTRQWYLEGRFVPWCSIDGHYQLHQCHRSHCYCVSKVHGVEAYRSRVEIFRGDAVCSHPVLESECEGQRKTASSSGLYGSYKPQCKPDGNFHEVQCHGSFCFCVNQRGVQIPGTRVPIGSKLHCQNIATILSPCERAVQESLYRGDDFVPRCTNDGHYQDVQCNVSSCWCVDRDGQEIRGTRSNSIVTCPGKGAYSSPCWKEYQSMARQPNSLGRYVPQCNLDGSYMKVQCHRGYCFCVDANGAELREFSVNVGLHGKPVCKKTDAEKTGCQKKRMAAIMANPSVVAFVPECRPDGSYSDVQCNRLSNQCWCTDAEGNEMKGTRTNGTLRCATRKTDNETLCERTFFTTSGPAIGLWNHVAVCHVNGFYRPIQCDGRKGYCWCVKENGKPRWNTVTRSLPKCNVDDRLTNCQEHRARLLGIPGKVTDDIYVPQCKKNGDYEQIQCHTIEGVQYCWCVDALGIEMPNTRQRGRPSNCLPKPEESQCRLQVQQALRTEVTKGRFVPRCQSNGDFEEVQCNEWTGYCWCVDRRGKEIKNTRTKDFIFCPGLGRDLTNCQRKYQEAERDKFTSGRFMPRCTPQGEYVPVQCQESECYCVNYYGHEIFGTRLRMPARPNCTHAVSGQTECQYRREAALANAVPGAPIPQCTPEGGYDKVQCRESSCYCVDMRGKEIPGTTLAIANGKPKCDNPALKLSLCQRQYQEYWRNPISGRYVPRCDSTGQFEPVQCYGSYCFCVDLKGVEKQGTSVLQTLQTIDCSNIKKPLTPCQTLLAKQTVEPPKPGRVIPRCASDGSFLPVQCDSLSKECWCVNATNYEIPDTRKKEFVQCGQVPKGLEPQCNSQNNISHFKTFSPNCSSNNGFQSLQCDFRYGYCWCSDVNGNLAQSDVVRGKAICPNIAAKVPLCKIHRLRVLGPTGVAQPGAFIPQCFEDGNYDRVQCDGSSSFCWCVDENGFEEPASREFGRPNCEEKIGRIGQENGINKRIEAPCHQARQRVLSISEVPKQGVFVPVCKTDGSFKPVQCHSSTGFCWCVDQYGQERTGTRTQGKPQCGPVENLTACQNDRMRAFGWNGRFIVGLMIPRCRPDGSFEPQQCHESTGQCWCVDENGNELHGTRSNAQISCSSQVGTTSCQHAKETSEDDHNPFDCDNSGGFSPKQCSIGNGEPRQCWCVDRHGKEIPRTRTTGGINCDDISAGLTSCQRERQVALGWSGVARADVFVPDCTADGGYENIQCHEATGFCWCVDGNGNELVETRMRARPICERKVSRSPCLMERQRALGWSRNHNGAFVPQCHDNGRYDLVQCHHRTCWCVDEFGYELPDTRSESGTPDCNTRPAYFTACYQWRTRIIGKSPSSVLSQGVIVPECDSSGAFVNMQCSISTGHCWCVDVHGNVLTDTYTRGQVDCDNRGSLTKCQKERTDALAARAKDPRSQTFLPACDKNGGYRPDQCDTSLGECWCVNHLGNEEAGTRVKAQGTVCELQAGLTACQREQRRAYGFVDKPPSGRFVPKCKPDGSYDDVQCQESGYCWCVDVEGIEVLGTRKKGKPLCYAAARLSKCQTERKLTLGPNKTPLLGQFVPKCRKDGSYAEIQCDRSVGECWCVDEGGRERIGTRQFGKPIDCYEEVFSLCHRERHRALGWTGLHVPNLFVPECKLDGTYETIQCHLATRYCWCVDRWGHEWPGTRVKGTPDCGKTIDIGKNGVVSAMPTSCQMDQWRALIWSEQFDSIYGVFSPDCTSDGRYKPVQCNTHTSYCWCVDEKGNEIWGTRVRGDRPDCNAIDTNTTTCSKSVAEGDSLRRVNFYFGRFVPKCDSSGGYEPIQCDQSGYCWCVDRYGQELPRTKVKGIPQTCGLFAGTTSCQRESYLVMSLGGNPTLGRYKAECERDGSYKMVQCDKASGYCWCVDENGIEIPRSQVARGTPTCGSMAVGLPPCHSERFRSLPWLNKFAPTCNDDGSYPQLQCFGAYCWCVTKNGNEIARTRTREKISCSLILTKDYETTCQYRQRKARSNSLAEFTPVCDRLGGYHPIQCLEGSPYCWCVDKYGVEIPRTRSKTVPECHYQAGLTMCQKELQIAIGWTGIAAPGQFVPKCRPDGSYELVQCHGLTGFCWCVDKDGNELSGTRRKGAPICSIYVTLRPCLNERERILGSLGEASPGRFVPSCTASGGYLPTQCHQSIGYCWCVDYAGREIPDTRRKGKAYCEEQETISTCNIELHLANAMSVPAAFYPSCERDGNYKEIQCRYNNGKSCWCVDENGNAIAGTETNGRPNCTNGEIKYTQCKLERFNSLVRRLNQTEYTDVIFIPQCRENGGYDDIQCYKGDCWCVNHRGVEIPGTRTRGKPYCQIPVCIQERMNALSYNRMPGRFVPKCDQDGSYADMQCHSATGYCWCSDELGREIPETRVRGKPICGIKDGALTICQRQRKIALRSINQGPFIPHCNQDGSFAPTQCHESDCYCVNKDGDEIQGSRVKLPLKPDCKKINGGKPLPGESKKNCMRQYRVAMDNFAISRFIPQCLPNGTYQPVQCDEGWYSCWCVDNFGNELARTRTTGWPKCPQAAVLPANPTQCQREYRAALDGYIYGRYVPRCQPDGNYEPMQCHSSLCFCVNMYGVEIDGTREPGLKPLKCKTVDPLTKCQKQFRVMRSKFPFGTFVPRCLADGSFALVQCGPSNYCWCVDKEGREMTNTRTRGWPTCGKKERQVSMCHQEFKTKRSNSSSNACAPLCKPDTGYDPMQCHAGTCFCVDKMGKEIRGTATPLPRVPKCLASDSLLSPCQRLYELSVQRHVLSRWIPNCRPDGTFDTVQCDRGWYCWCVDENGKELPGTRKGGWPECGVQAASDLGPCRKLYVLSLKQLVPGRFIPRCRSDGSFDPVQCFGSVCMCVDKHGVEIPGTTKPRFNEPDCSPLGWTLTPCQRHYQQAHQFGAVNQFVPTCDPDGLYNPMQCYGNICFCVDEKGFEISNARTNLPNKPVCSKNTRLTSMPCMRENAKAIQNTDKNAFVPRCRDDGSYHEVQCRGMTCHCVDSNGNEKRKTRTPRPLRPDCYGSLPSKCQRQYLDAFSNYQPGRYIPRCASNGDFAPIQTRSGFSYCVDKDGQEVLGTATRTPFSPRCETMSVPNRPRFSPSRCPVIFKDSNSCRKISNQCEIDSECPEDKKCCFDGCSNVCTDGIPEKPVDTCSKALDLAIGINASPNMTRCSWTRILDFLKRLVSHFDVSADKVNIGIVSYATNIKVENSFKSLTPALLNVEEIQRIVSTMFWRKGKSKLDKTLGNIEKRLFKTGEGMRPNSLKVFLIIEDGRQSGSSNQERLRQVSERLKNIGINILALSIDGNAKKNELLDIVSSSEDIFQNALMNLNEAVKPLAKFLCLEDKCKKVFDIAFVVDASDSIGRANWFIKKQFIKTILSNFRIRQDGVRVAIVVYSTEAEVILKFNTLKGGNLNENQVLKKIELMEWRKGFSFIDKGLELADREVFVTSAGMRTSVPKVLLVLTDGKQSRDEGPFTEPQLVSDRIKKKDVTVYSIGVGNIIDREELVSIASDSNKVVIAQSFGALQDVAGSIRTLICKGTAARFGACPKNWKGLFGRKCDDRPDGCNSDGDCPTPMKCCSSGCHRQCVMTNQAIAVPAFAVCEADQKSGIISCKCEGCPKKPTDPVCGSNNKTYPNDCMMRQDACKKNTTISVQKEGACGTCPKKWKKPFGRPCDDRPDECNTDSDCPIPMKCCSSGCHTQCVRANQALAVPAFAVCEADQTSGIINCQCEECSKNTTDPVCGSNNKTYPNECMMRQDACKKNKTISVHNKGACGSCPKSWKGIFGRKCDGRPDQCQSDSDCPTPMKCCSSGCHKQCVKAGQALAVPAFAVCEADQTSGIISCKCEECPKNTTDPVCGSNNKTYPNECMMRQDACKKNKTISAQKEGACGTCPRNWKRLFGEPCDDRLDECSSDSDCPIPMKCCSSGCHTQCVRANQAFALPAFAICEADQTSGIINCKCDECPKKPTDPVCGSNNKTYSNDCMMRQDACKINKTISVQKEGACGTCPRNWKRLFGRPCDGRPDKCNTDSDCHISMKCCSSGCHTQCVRANQAIAVPAFGVCEADQTSGIISCKCEECPKNTTDPVCGSNNKTYPNDCMMRQDACKTNKTISVQKEGACGTCPRNWKRLFGRSCDGRTDECNTDSDCPISMKCCSSGCHTQCVRANQATAVPAFGVCEADQTSGIISCKCEECPKNTTDPVCGSNNKTYPNECMMRQDACKKNKTISVHNKGACGSCPRNWKGIFGRKCDGKPDQCQSDSDCPTPMKCCSSGCHKQCVKAGQALAVPAFAVCEADQTSGIISCKCDQCPKKPTDPVCGSDNKTYPNECMMRQDACKRNKTISVHNKGACGTCPRNWKRLFGRPCDDRPDECTSDSDCPISMKCCSSGCHTQCVRANQAVAVPAFGVCEADQTFGIINCKCEECSKNTTDPVCGSNNKTYPNECMMRQDACKKNKTISVHNKGACGTCPRNWKRLFGRPCDGRPDECTSDSDCPISMKCCSSGCHTQCVRANQAVAVPAFVVCEVDQTSGIINCKCEECPTKPTVPICGSNNKTYPNECMMRQDACKKNKTISVHNKGTCGTCPRNWKRLFGRPCDERPDECSSDSDCPIPMKCCSSGCHTQCVRANQAVALPAFAVCEADQTSGIINCKCEECPKNNTDQVCGSDNKTYPNECMMRQDACKRNKTISVHSKGACGTCPMNWKGLFGRECDGRPDQCKSDSDCPPKLKCCSSGCHKQCVKPSQAFIFPVFGMMCEADQYTGIISCKCEECPENTTDPVCGSDNKTYPNECMMRQDACKKNETISVQKKGVCDPCKRFDCSSPPYSSCEVVKGKPVCSCRLKCFFVINWVCGADGNSYKNECEMRRAACISNKMITVRRKGHCNACYKYDCKSPPYSRCTVVNDKPVCSCRLNCSNAINWVCGADGNSYRNECEMRRAACIGNKMINVRRKGHCDPCYKFNCKSKPYSSCEAINDKAGCVCPSQCPVTMDYVCGSDGNSYDNECQMRRAACRSNKMITVSRKGHCNACYKYECKSPPYSRCTVVNDKPACSCRLNCSNAINWVCGSDGNSYRNECEMKRAACISNKMITVSRNGHCDACYKYECDSPPYSRCTVVNDKPVCSCRWNCSNAIIWVCGSDGNSYRNECEMRRAACISNKMIKVRRNGHCDACYKYECKSPPYSRCTVVNDKPVCSCRLNCSNAINWVCGADGNSYKNECEMRRAACRSNKMVTVRRKGHCDACYKYECKSPPYSRCTVVNDKPVCSCRLNCSNTINWVCGSDGNSYRNECEMRRAACISNKMITVRKKGHCNPCFEYKCSSPPYSTCTNDNDKAVCSCRFQCPTTYDYVCGSDGNTYDNECQMRQASCRNNKMITVRRKGHCNPCFGYKCSSLPHSTCTNDNDKAVCACRFQCPTTYDYVCGSDGNTYDNECQMRQASCRSKKMITVRRKGHCNVCFEFDCSSTPYSSCEAINDKAGCVCPSQCPLTMDYVCGSDGNTYDNECRMRQAACRSKTMMTVRNRGQCDPCFEFDCSTEPYSSCKKRNDKAVCECPEKCPTIVDRVCGTNRKTYDNECLMRQASCRKGIMITVRRKGICKPCAGYNCALVRPFSTCKVVDDNPECVCPVCEKKEPDYACYSNGMHYRSECSMRRASCNLNQTLTFVSKGKCVCDAKVDLGILVDSSGSIGRKNWVRMKDFVNSVIKSFKVGGDKTHVATISYSTEPEIILKFNTLTGSAVTAEAYGNYINSMRWQRGYTYIDKALILANTDLFEVKDGMRTNVPKILFLITDGIQTKRGEFTPLAEASRPLKQKGVRVYVMGIGKSLAKEELEDIATNRNRDVFFSESFQLLKPKVQEIIDKVCFPDPCDTYVCSKPYSVCELDDESPVCVCPKTCPYRSEPVCGSDDVTYRNPCLLRKTACEKNKLITVAAESACKCKTVLDLVFVVDSSGSIGRRNWITMKEFLSQIISEFQVGEDGTHVAMVTYSSTAKVEFTFNTLTGSRRTAQEYAKIVNAMRLQRGYTFIDKGIAKANQMVLTAVAGMRESVDKICIVITDGIQTKDRGTYTPLDQAVLPIKQKGFRVYSLGIGGSVDQNELRQLVSDPAKNVFSVASFKELRVKTRSIMEELCPEGNIKLKSKD